ncbi:MAG: hypothetical protein KDC43_22515 [Saprospiraceae bacterium]|nr:hypothetical protein [Saprospiraceae bacterium]MCB0626610.1 hypothetical protein [Saprospiraceae bacterium]MCB0678885.1 hypothetical protein [Saprospiraceae bacterium]MCB0680633.1 hypothetical protein [Saprospiraceae bacterium]
MVSRFFFLFGFFLLVFLACQKEDLYTADPGYEYFPVGIGYWWEYQVDSIVYDPTSVEPIDSVRVYWREEVTDTLSDLAGRTIYRIDRFERAADTSTWQIKEVVTALVEEGRATRTENNLELIPLIFPLQADSRWNPTAFVDPTTIVIVAGESIELFKGWEASVKNLGEPATVGSDTFPETVQIALAGNENLIELREATEIYAKGVGLVSRYWRILDTQTLDPGIPWEDKAEKGFILRQNLLNYAR